MFQIKRELGSFYSKGNYNAALDCAVKLQKYVEKAMGKENAIYASCLNNIALMNKLLGNYEVGIDYYIDALHKYEDVVGRNNSSYVSTLTNLGVLCKLFAEQRSGAERMELLLRADEALTDASTLRVSISGSDHKDTLLVSTHLAGLWRVQGQIDKAEQEYRRLYKRSINLFGQMDSLSATLANNLGLLLKTKGEWQEARELYELSLDARSRSLGDAHPDTIISMHNLSELLHSTGKEEEALQIQRQILAVVGDDQTEQKGDDRLEGSDTEKSIHHSSRSTEEMVESVGTAQPIEETSTEEWKP
eukprot:CAMPEP_0182423028 /NCGR_PEP_ID=MMETSP1167-20130531/8913_1 /TAXON_ID=2988 /ORGANISM="Mallomonas Sp, Strain CCMP3275" /LENGTH=303 /DNA_ID=CAMNT_0024601609 /DNA_START=111 /DNA_END=1022 /DNA_ORIENTATION=-